MYQELNTLKMLIVGTLKNRLDFLDIWAQGKLFCFDMGRSHWNPASSPEFMPQEYNIHMASIPIDRRTNHGAATDHQPTHSDSMMSGSDISPPTISRAWGNTCDSHGRTPTRRDRTYHL